MRGTIFRNLVLALLTTVVGSALSVRAESQSVDVAPIFSPVDLDNLVGPIALYPDDVLAVLLPASTYPLQVVEAQRFLDANPQEGDALDDDWDPTIVAMLNYPEALALLSGDLGWTATLGDAVLAQENDVLEAIERFRDAAWLAGNLESNERQQVVRSEDSIEILPAEPDVIYLPYYDPVTVVVRQPAPAVRFYDWGYPLYYHTYPSAWVFNRLFWRVPTFYEISWRNRYLHLYGFDYGFWWHRRSNFYGYAPRNIVHYNRYRRGNAAYYNSFRANRWQHRSRPGVRSSRYQRYGDRGRYTRSTEGRTRTVRPDDRAVASNQQRTYRRGSDTTAARNERATTRYSGNSRDASADRSANAQQTRTTRGTVTQPRSSNSRFSSNSRRNSGETERSETVRRYNPAPAAARDQSSSRYSTRGRANAASTSRSTATVRGGSTRAAPATSQRQVTVPRSTTRSSAPTTRSRSSGAAPRSQPSSRSSNAGSSRSGTSSRSSGASSRSSGARSRSNGSSSRNSGRSSRSAGGQRSSRDRN